MSVLEDATLSNDFNQIMRDMMENFSFYSGIVVTFSVLMLSISISNPMKGGFYVAWVLFSTVVRLIFLIMTNNITYNGNEKCKKGGLPGKLSNYDGGRNSIYILCFTLLYIWFPMFITNNVNWYLVWLIITCIAFDSMIKYTSQCVTSGLSIIGEMLGGATAGLFISGFMYYLGLSRFLFINSLNGNKEVCSVPKKQTYKCAVYKNGEIISSMKA